MANFNVNSDKNEPKVVALWAVPRSSSNAFLKTFFQRTDTKAIHEPYTFIYYFSQWRRSTRWDEYKEYYNYDATAALKTIQTAIDGQKSGLVFFKELPYQVLPYVGDEFKEFLSSITNTFLICHPKIAIASWYRINEDITDEEFGFDALAQMWHIVTQDLKQVPIVVETSRFRQDPERVLRQYCQQVGIPFEPDMLTWQDGRLKPWTAREIEFHGKWHRTLDRSTRIMPPAEVEIDIQSQDLERYESALKVYEKLQQIAL